VSWLAVAAVEELEPRAARSRHARLAAAAWPDSEWNMKGSDLLGNPLATLQACEWPEAQCLKWKTKDN